MTGSWGEGGEFMTEKRMNLNTSAALGPRVRTVNGGGLTSRIKYDSKYHDHDA